MEMVKYKLEAELEVLPQDQDALELVPDTVLNRFHGTCIRVSRVTVTRHEENE